MEDSQRQSVLLSSVSDFLNPGQIRRAVPYRKRMMSGFSSRLFTAGKWHALVGIILDNVALKMLCLQKCMHGENKWMRNKSIHALFTLYKTDSSQLEYVTNCIFLLDCGF